MLLRLKVGPTQGKEVTDVVHFVGVCVPSKVNSEHGGSVIVVFVFQRTMEALQFSWLTIVVVLCRQCGQHRILNRLKPFATRIIGIPP